MNILDITYSAPLDTLVAIIVLSINSLFCLAISNKYNLYSSFKINLVLINILFYLFLSLLIFLISLFFFNLTLLRFFFYSLLIVQIIYIFKKNDFVLKKIDEVIYFLKNQTFFTVIIFTILILVCSPTTDADSLDYHLGGPVEIIRSGGLFPRLDDWLSHRLIMSGEILNLYGLILGAKNFGQIFHIIPIIILFTIFIFSTEKKFTNYNLQTLLIFSSPLLVSIFLSQKQILFPSIMLILSFAILLKDKNIDVKNIPILLLLILTPISFKYSYLIYSIPLYFYVFLITIKKINIFKLVSISFIIFSIFVFPYLLKNFIFYSDPITPFFESFKKIPTQQVLYFAEELRFSKKIFEFYEIPIIPFLHIISLDITKITLLLTPGVLFLYVLIFNYKNLNQSRKLFILCLTIFFLMSFSGKSLSRFYFDIYLMIILIFLNNYYSFRNNILVKGIINLSKVYFLIFYLLCLVGIFLFFQGILSNKEYIKVLSKYGFSIEESRWVNENTLENSVILFDRDIMRSKILHKNKFNYVNFSFTNNTKLKTNILKKNYSHLVISEENFKNFLKEYYVCDIDGIKRTKLKLRSRNFFNKKVITDILLIDKVCLKLN